MTIATNLQRIINAKTATKAAIIEKGVEVPDTEKLDTYYNYIDQISSDDNDFPEPDLSQPLDEAELENLQNIVAAGKASEYLNTGDELLASYGTYTMSFEVVGFEPVEVEGGETVPAINLLAEYTSETTTAWGGSYLVKYSASTLRANILNTYQSKLDPSFVSCLANRKTQTYGRDGSTDTVYDKLYAPAMGQLGVTDGLYTSDQQRAVEGPAFTAYENATDSMRIKNSIDPTTTPQYYWTRSCPTSNKTRYDCILNNGAPNVSSYDSQFRMVVACDFIGNSIN